MEEDPPQPELAEELHPRSRGSLHQVMYVTNVIFLAIIVRIVRPEVKEEVKDVDVDEIEAVVERQI